MTSITIRQCENVEDEWFDVVIECLVIKEQLSQQTQVLAVDLRHIAINFKYGQVFLTIDFIARRMQQCTATLQNSNIITQAIQHNVCMLKYSLSVWGFHRKYKSNRPSNI